MGTFLLLRGLHSTGGGVPANPYHLLNPLFFFTDPAPTSTYALSLHDALPISSEIGKGCASSLPASTRHGVRKLEDRKSTRLNSSHRTTSYAVFCLKKKKTLTFPIYRPLRSFTTTLVSDLLFGAMCFKLQGNTI